MAAAMAAAAVEAPLPPANTRELQERVTALQEKAFSAVCARRELHARFLPAASVPLQA